MGDGPIGPGPIGPSHAGPAGSGQPLSGPFGPLPCRRRSGHGPQPADGTRDCILDVAARLFDEHGVHAVGLQQVIDEYGCGKNLLYREFPSKDDLVVAWLERCRREWAEKIERIIEPHADDPAAQLLAIVRAAADDLTVPGFRGCSLRNTHVEFPDPDHPAHRISVRYVEENAARCCATSPSGRRPRTRASWPTG